LEQAVVAGFAGLALQVDVRRVAEMPNRRCWRRLQIENRPAMAIEAGIGVERDLARRRWLRARWRVRMAARARQPHGQMRPVREIVRLRDKGGRGQNRRDRMTESAQYIDDDSNHWPAISPNREGENFVFWFGGLR